MAGDNQAKTEFQQILQSINRLFDIIHTKWTEQKFFEAKFRTQIPRESEDFNFLCDEWVDLFSQVTSTVWVKKISNTGPKIRFRKQYQCWTHGGKTVQKELLFDARRCKGTLDIKVLTDNPLTRRKNKHIRLGLNVVVKINFIHLHPVAINKPFAFFVHKCEPLPEPPKPVVAPNDKLPQLVAEMVQKGLNSTSKAVTNPSNTTAVVNITTTVTSVQNCKNTGSTVVTAANKTSNEQLQSSLGVLQNQQQLKIPVQQQEKASQPSSELNSVSQAPIQYIEDPSVQIIPIQNMDNIKFQVQPQLTQVVLATPQLEVTEPVFMCQPTLMYEPAELIPMTTIPPHFVQVHPSNVYSSQQGHFL